MILSTGIDIVEIKRIQIGYDRYQEKYLERIFSEKEIEIIKSRKAGMIPTMAGKFAAKEALIKALDSILEDDVFLKDIEILNKPSGRPYVQFNSRLQPKLEGRKVDISISHERNYAVAVAILSEN